MSSQLNIRDLEMVIALHEEGNFTRAAKRIGISEPALSKRLQFIEQYVHAQLFERRHDGAYITDSGRMFIEHTSDILHRVRRAVHEAQEAKNGEFRKLHIGVSVYLHPRLIEILHSIELPLYPELAIEIATGSSPELISDLCKRHVELALVTSPPPNNALTSQCIATCHFMIIFRKGHPLADKQSVTLDEIVEYPWVFFNRPLHPHLHDLILRRVEAKRHLADIVHFGSHVDQTSALLNNDSILGWLNPAGVDSAVNQGFVCVPLIDDEIHMETHLVSLAENRSPLVSEFARRFVKCWEARNKPEQLSLPIN
jgi:DNA-binding transcriptional LysR family regulator